MTKCSEASSVDDTHLFGISGCLGSGKSTLLVELCAEQAIHDYADYADHADLGCRVFRS